MVGYYKYGRMPGELEMGHKEQLVIRKVSAKGKDIDVRYYKLKFVQQIKKTALEIEPEPQILNLGRKRHKHVHIHDDNYSSRS